MDDDPLLVDMMANWRKSDFIMDWCRKRAAQNLANATNPLQQHPYEPSYNFEAGIAPLLQIPIKGVIWYQGESDTNNVEIYDHLFPVLVKSENNGEESFHFIMCRSRAWTALPGPASERSVAIAPKDSQQWHGGKQ